ncbi:MAG: hypothetical protein Q9225_005824 [Loekoesia sp. 1 TL-2023]
MQTLWTRIARIHITRPQWSHKSSARSSSTAFVARRSTTAPIQRRLGLNDVCAAFFSTVVFASAVADGKRKDARRAEWVKAIKEARMELSTLKADQERHISSFAHDIGIGSALHKTQSSIRSPQTWQDVFTWADGEMRERKALGYQDWRGIPLSVLREAPPGQINDFQDCYRHCFARFRGSPGAQVWNTVTWPLHIKKVRTLEWSIAYLTLQLISQAPPSLPLHPRITDDILLQLSLTSPKERYSKLAYIRKKLKTLRCSKESDEYYQQFESPKYPQYGVNQMNHPSAADQLNANLHALFESFPPKSGRITKTLPDICYYLLTSDAPPNIHTYNLLVLEFAGRNQNDLVGYLLQSINRTHMRPNEVTLAQTLQHYTRTRQCSNFDRYVDEMDGFGEGLAVASPRLDIPDLLKFQHRVRVIRTENNGKTTNMYHDYSKLSKSDISALKRKATVRVYEKPRRNRDVYQALIQGALLFHGKSEGMKHYRTMTSEGWEPNKEILLSILDRCVVDRDWNAGIATWTRLHGCRALVAERAYILMLQLCRKSNKNELIPELLHNGISQGILPPTVFETGLHKLSRYEKPQDVDKTLSVAKDVWKLEQGLEQLVQEQRGLSEDLPVYSERANHLMNMIKTSLRYPSFKTIALLHEARILFSNNHQLSGLDTTLREFGVRILRMVNELKHIQLSTRVLELEAQLKKASLAMVQFVEDTRSILLSLCLQSLEDCFDRISASVMLLKDDVRFRMSCINVERPRARCYAIEEQTNFLRKETSSFVVSPFESLIQDLQRRMKRLQDRIRGTSFCTRDLLTKIYARAVTFESADKGGSGWEHHMKSRAKGQARLDASQQLNSKQTDAVEVQKPLLARMDRQATSNSAQPTSKFTIRKCLINPTVKIAYCKSRHQEDAARPRFKRLDYLVTGSEGTLDVASVHGQRLPKQLTAARNDVKASRTYGAWDELPLSLDISQGDAYPSSTCGLDDGRAALSSP